MYETCRLYSPSANSSNNISDEPDVCKLTNSLLNCTEWLSESSNKMSNWPSLVYLHSALVTSRLTLNSSAANTVTESVIKHPELSTIVRA